MKICQKKSQEKKKYAKGNAKDMSKRIFLAYLLTFFLTYLWLVLDINGFIYAFPGKDEDARAEVDKNMATVQSRGKQQKPAHEHVLLFGEKTRTRDV